ncbi:MAG: glycosyltransferase family 4 protein [Candidatus Babeliales bacterium]
MVYVLGIRLLFGVLISFLITFYLIPLMQLIAKKHNIMDMPDGQIKLHKEPTPYLGGMAVYIGFLTALAFIFPFNNHMMLIVVGLTLLFFIGLIDDLIPLKAYQKFGGQALVAFCFLKAGFYLKTTFFLSNWWSMGFSLLWIATVINAFNLVDVMDGLASTLAICATISFGVIAVISGQASVLLLLAPFLGSLLAFLWYNRPKAQIYLGDTGSLVIGGFLSVIPFLFNWGTYGPYGFLTPLIILAIPLLEVGTLIVVRTYKGIPFYNGSPDHFSIYLQQKKWTKIQILIYVALLSVVLCAASALVFLHILPWGGIVALGTLFLAMWYAILLRN